MDINGNKLNTTPEMIDSVSKIMWIFDVPASRKEKEALIKTILQITYIEGSLSCINAIK